MAECKIEIDLEGYQLSAKLAIVYAWQFGDSYEYDDDADAALSDIPHIVAGEYSCVEDVFGWYDALGCGLGDTELYEVYTAICAEYRKRSAYTRSEQEGVVL